MFRALFRERRKILINGKWVEAASGKTFPTYNPATGEVLSRVAEGDKEDIDRAVKAARAAFESGPWSKITPSERGRMIWKIGGFDRKASGRIRAARIARQWQALDGRARCRRAARGRSVPLHGGVGHQDRRKHNSDFGGRRKDAISGLHGPRADRRRRANHSLEFPAADGGVEAGSGSRHRLHGRAEARGADAPHRPSAWRIDSGSRAFPTAW